ncbi:hypothetical protein [Lactococcus ileimucosae]|uniref:hypothetical protein n=1 Tax=Lactococcus ileimucosae TaxID=2941329 RepID=UPI0035147D7D
MKNIIQEEDSLSVKGDAKGSVLTAFAIICLISLPYMYIVGGTMVLSLTIVLAVILLLLSGLKIIKDRKKLYLKLDKKTLIVYPYGSEKQSYIVPVERILYLTTKDFRKSTNNSIFTLVLTAENKPEVQWINEDWVQTLNKHEIKLDYLPVKKKDFPQFVEILEKTYALSYRKNG